MPWVPRLDRPAGPRMSKPRFRIDEDTWRALGKAIHRLEPALDVIRVGDPGAPLSGTLDPELLLAAESLGRVLVSRDRQTMPGHLSDHYAAGHHTAGLILLKQRAVLGRTAQDIVKQWAMTTADDWVDRTIYLP